MHAMVSGRRGLQVVFAFLIVSILQILPAQSTMGAIKSGVNVADEGGFYLPKDLPLAPENFATIQKAVVKMDDCSAVLLSNTGYVATALHCVLEYLTPTWNYIPDIQQVGVIRPGVYNALRIDERVPSRLSPPAHIRNRYHIYEHQMSNPRIVWIGQGRMSHDERKITTISEAEYLKIRDLTEDVVILKYDLHPEFPHVPCLTIAERTPEAGEIVWQFGFPGRNERLNGRGSDGTSRYGVWGSIGRVRGSLQEDPILMSYTDGMSDAEQALYWQREFGFWHKPSILQTTADTFGGNSGGATVDANGNLLSITFSVSKSDAHQYMGATSFGARMTEIRKKAARDLGEELAAEVFACERQ